MTVHSTARRLSVGVGGLLKRIGDLEGKLIQLQQSNTCRAGSRSERAAIMQSSSAEVGGPRHFCIEHSRLERRGVGDDLPCETTGSPI